MSKKYTCFHRNNCLFSSLGLLSTEPVSLQGTPMKALAAHLEKRLELGKVAIESMKLFYFTSGSDEYDTVILQHRIGIETLDKKKVLV